MFAYFRAPADWGTLVRETVKETYADGCPALAAQLAFYFFLGVFPALLFLVSLVSYLSAESLTDQLVRALAPVAPQEILQLLRRQVQQAVESRHVGLLTLGMVGAVWSSSAAMMAIVHTLNRAYDIEEWRPWWKTRLLAVGLTLALAAFVLLAFGLVLGGSTVGRWLAQQIGAGELFARAWALLQWPLAFALVVFAVDLVYHFAPNADTEWVWVTPGSLLATTLWLLTSLGFKFYVNQVGGFGAVYGAIGSVIVLLLWFYLSGFSILIGAELNAEIDKRMPTRDDAPQGPARRKKIGAAAEREHPAGRLPKRQNGSGR